MSPARVGIRQNGTILWLRHHGVPVAVVISTVAALAIRAALTAISADGGGVDVAPLWLGTVIMLPQLFTFIHEDATDRSAPRSLACRRAVLFSITVVFSAAASWILTPDSPDGLGPLATWRNCWALMGLGLLGLGCLGSFALWALPLAVALASMLFAWPLHPGTAHGVLGFLRAPAGLHFTSGAWNLSIPTSLLLATAGLIVHLRTAPGAGPQGMAMGVMRFHGASREPASLSRGLRHVSLQYPLLIAAGALSAWTSMSSLSKWGGSPRLLLGVDFPSASFIHAPMGAVIGVIVAQIRWRTGTAVWEQCSPRGRWALLGQQCRRAIAITACAVGAPTGILALVSTALLASQSGIAVAARELTSALPTAALVLGEAIALSIAGTTAGWLVRGAWMAPSALLLALAAMIPAPRIPTQDADRVWAGTYPRTACASAPPFDVTLCTTAPLRPYLQPAVRTVTTIYQASPRPQVLPRKIILTNRGPMGVAVPGTLVPAVSVDRHRGLRTPEDFGGSGAESLLYSIQSWCPATDLGDLQQLLGLLPQERSRTMPTTLAALQRCRQQE